MTVRLSIKDMGKNYFVKILPEKEYVIGRSSSCNIRVEDDGISGKHCKITLKMQFIYVEDLGSHNGTRLNGKKVKGLGQKFFIGDTIRVGNSTFKLDSNLMTIREKKCFKNTGANKDSDSDLTMNKDNDSLIVVDFNDKD